jgi:hypothetical protein
MTRHRWEDNIKTDLYEEGCGDMDWFDLTEDRDRWQTLVNAVMNFQVTYEACSKRDRTF